MTETERETKVKEQRRGKRRRDKKTVMEAETFRQKRDGERKKTIKRQR